ncbi:REP-associated tyrosine transposase [Foetidibacter luteolus]|uniref:REP-associated tyrosine transposase n=1 Tax=Foetidibacter luteolus TaxID=2608880 RepID=UPI00129AF292|nr:transposase [Foetidibacter luteolus]
MQNPYFTEGYSIKDQFATHFLTFTVCGWIDLFTRKVYKDIVIESLKYTQKQQQLVLYAYVIMSNHMHLIARAEEKQRKTLSDIIRDFKKFTHREMITVIKSERESRREWMMHQFAYYGRKNPKNEAMQIWTNSNHPEECITKKFTDVKLNYIHDNPVRAGIVENPEDYIYFSAANYAGKKGIIDVELL